MRFSTLPTLNIFSRKFQRSVFEGVDPAGHLALSCGCAWICPFIHPFVFLQHIESFLGCSWHDHETSFISLSNHCKLITLNNLIILGLDSGAFSISHVTSTAFSAIATIVECNFKLHFDYAFVIYQLTSFSHYLLYTRL